MIMYYSVFDGNEGTTPRSDGFPLTSRSNVLQLTSRSDRGTMEEGISDQYPDMVQDLGHTQPVMVDSYISRMNSVTGAVDDSREITQIEKFDNSAQDTDRKGMESVRSARRKWPSYLSPPNGLRIITWDEFIETPDMLNGHFVLEKNGYISHDASQVNLFFQDARTTQTNLGSASQSGKAWTIFTQDYQELKSIRSWLTERISVLAVTLYNKNHTQHDLGSTACCLLAIDPSFDSIREKLQQAFSQALESFLNQRHFCIILDFNSGVERWCEDVLRMRCKANGAKIIITNGDEPPELNGNGDNVCCHYLCLPFKLLRGTAYKVQRRANYDDLTISFDEEFILLCTSNTKLQEYAEKAQPHIPPPSTRRTNKKKNTVTFTEGTQTSTDSSRNSKSTKGDCGVIDLEHMERGCEDENISTARDTAYERVIRDKNRAQLWQDVDSQAESKSESKSSKNESKSSRNESKSSKNESKNRPKGVAQEFDEREPEDSTELDIVETIGGCGGCGGCDGDDSYVDSRANQHERSCENSGVIDVKVDVHCASYNVNETRVSDNHVGYSKVKNDPKPIETIIVEYDEMEEVKTSMQALKIDNYVPDAQFSIDVYDDPAQSLKGKPITKQPTNPKSNAKQQKKIDKMLKDIMGPGLDPSKKPPRKGKTKSGVTNAAILGDEDSQVSMSLDRTRISEVVPGFSTLQVSKPRSGKPNSKSTDYDNRTRSDTPISPKKANKIKKKFEDRSEEKLFTPRFMLEQDRNCFSDLDPVDEFTDVDAIAASDNEGLVSSRLISVKNTSKTVSVDTLQMGTDTELEITDCDTEDMSVTSEDVTARARRKSRTNKRPERGQKGANDSRRRYLALNSLRRKTKAKMMNVEIRNRIRGVNG